MKEKIKADVISYIAAYANLSPTKIKEEYILKEHPLHYDDMSLANLIILLRAYLRGKNPKATLFSSEIRKKGLTVKNLIQLIQERAGA